jgi:cysteate synthase
MKDTDGDFFAVTNDEAEAAGKLFEELEGIDINPAAAVATASLIQAVENNQVEKDAVIMLNITGGGEKRFKENKEIFYLKPTKVFDVDASKEDIKEFLRTLEF